MILKGSKSAVAVGALLALVLGCNTAARKRNTATSYAAGGHVRSPSTGDGRPALAVAPSWGSVAISQYHAQQMRSAEEEVQAIGYKKSPGMVLKVRRASVAPVYANAGKPLFFEMDYALLSSEQELDVSEEWEILKDGKRLTGTVPQTESRRPGRWRVRASINLPRTAKPGTYVVRSSVRAGNLADSREAQFRVAAVTEASLTDESKGTGPVDRDLMQIQGRLKELGHDPGPIDGRMRPQTQAALKAFQNDYGLAPTGEIDPETRAALGLSRGTAP
jgi:Putative peptidoglycan binding domain